MSLLNMLVSQRRIMLLLIAALGSAAAIGLLMARQPLPTIVAASAAPLAFALLIWPDILVLATVFILYTNAAVVAVRFHGLPAFAIAAIPLLLVIPFAHTLIFRRQKIILNPVLKLLILFLLIQVLGALASRDVNASEQSLATFATEGIGLYFLIINTVRTPKMLRQATWALLIAGALLGGASAYQQVTQTYDNNYGGFAQIMAGSFRTGAETIQGEVRQFRLAGSIGETNRYAQIMLMLVPLGLFRFWGERSAWLRVLAALATGLTALGGVLAFSRGAAVGFVLMLALMVVMRYINLRRLAVMVLGVALVLTAIPQYGTRLASLQGLSSFLAGEGTDSVDGAIEGRATETLAAALVFADYPLFGVGPGMFKYYAQEYAELVDIRALTTTRQAHNLYLGVAAENGVFGLICLLVILFVTLRDLVRGRARWIQPRPDLAHLMTGYMFAVVAYMTTGLFLHFAYIRYFWLIMALAAAASSMVEEDPGATAESTGGGQQATSAAL